MLFDILKIVFPLLVSGAAGAALNEWFRRRSGKLQAIPLIERVNRLVSPDLKGFTLARVSGSSQSPQLQQVENVREYQLTLRNTSPIYLQDIEIQFEFPTEDIEGWASRPAISKTAPEPVDATVTSPWKKGFRWRIPRFPSTDSMEFNFKAVNPASEDFEVLLYNTDRVVIEKLKGEPSPQKSSRVWKWVWALMGVVGLFGVLIGVTLNLMFPAYGNLLIEIKEGGCDLRVISSFERYEGEVWKGPWQIKYRVFNAGTQSCIVQSDQLDAKGPLTLGPGETIERERLGQFRNWCSRAKVRVERRFLDYSRGTHALKGGTASAVP